MTQNFPKWILQRLDSTKKRESDDICVVDGIAYRTDMACMLWSETHLTDGMYNIHGDNIEGKKFSLDNLRLGEQRLLATAKLTRDQMRQFSGPLKRKHVIVSISKKGDVQLNDEKAFVSTSTKKLRDVEKIHIQTVFFAQVLDYLDYNCDVHFTILKNEHNGSKMLIIEPSTEDEKGLAIAMCVE